jgi:carboxypeptidase C (cathepsin A)
MRNFPKYKGRKLFLAGEGLAGHIIPIVSKYIINQGNPDIELFGVAIGNGWVDPFYQLPAHN